MELQVETSTQSITEDIDVRATMSSWPDVQSPEPGDGGCSWDLIDLPH